MNPSSVWMMMIAECSKVEVLPQLEGREKIGVQIKGTIQKFSGDAPLFHGPVGQGCEVAETRRL
jgi:hypothetical protein